MAVIIHTQHKCIACGQPERVHMQNTGKVRFQKWMIIGDQQSSIFG